MWKALHDDGDEEDLEEHEVRRANPSLPALWQEVRSWQSVPRGAWPRFASVRGPSFANLTVSARRQDLDPKVGAGACDPKGLNSLNSHSIHAA